MKIQSLMLFAVLCTNLVYAQTEDGQVTLPLATYQQLLKDPGTRTTAAIPQAELAIIVGEDDVTVSANLQISVTSEEDGHPAIVPLLSEAVALEFARFQGNQAQVAVGDTGGLFWISRGGTSGRLQMQYRVPVDRKSGLLRIPVPRAAETGFRLEAPQSLISVEVRGALGLQKSVIQGRVQIDGSVASANQIIVTWKGLADTEFAFTSASLTGEVRGDAVRWDAQITLQTLETDVLIPIIGTNSVLVSLELDGSKASPRIGDDRYQVAVSEAGEHQIAAVFETPIGEHNGLPATQLAIPRIPIAAYTLRLEGDQELLVAPATNVQREVTNDRTVARFYAPLTQDLRMAWRTAVPEPVDEISRMNAVATHAFHAAEGVLYGTALLQYEIARGESDRFAFSLPDGANINRIVSDRGPEQDWVESTTESGMRRVDVYPGSRIAESFSLRIELEQLLEDSEDPLQTPLVRALDVTRQTGIVALLTGQTLALKPVAFEHMAETGENQLQADFRNSLTGIVTHTFRYHDATASLQVETVAPERQQGKFDAQIDTLYSIGEVTLRAQSTVEIDVKTGVLRGLSLTIPSDVNLLSVAGPNIRAHKLVDEDNSGRILEIDFTQDMQGRFAIDLAYERLLTQNTESTPVPLIAVMDADVEHARLAIEALSALEIKAARVEQLSNIDLRELPRLLLLKTTNPILLAYKYVRTQSPIALELSLTRHEEIELQQAVIDVADYHTLVTGDGLAVTQAQYSVRNARRQFLRLAMPEGAELWSVEVGGEPQKPAFATPTEERPERDVLIKMRNAEDAFSVTLVYATPMQSMGAFGSLELTLPTPDMIATQTQWDVYLPPGRDYGDIDTSLERSHRGQSARDSAVFSAQAPGAPKIQVPAGGIRYSFEKLYANQGSEGAYVKVSYRDPSVRQWASAIAALATLLIWAGVLVLWRGQTRNGWLLIAIGGALLVFALTAMDADWEQPATLSIGAGLLLGLAAAIRWYRNRKSDADSE